MAGKGTVDGKVCKSADGPVTITEHAITFSLTDDEIAQAKRCLATSGAVKYTFKEITVTQLPMALENGRLID
jgi:hypothetical protein